MTRKRSHSSIIPSSSPSTTRNAPNISLHKSIAKMKIMRNGEGNSSFLPQISAQNTSVSDESTTKFSVSESNVKDQTRPRRHSFQVPPTTGKVMDSLNVPSPLSKDTPPQRRRSTSFFGTNLPEQAESTTKYRKKVEFDTETAINRRKKRLELIRQHDEKIDSNATPQTPHDDAPKDEKDDEMERALEDTELRAQESRQLLLSDLNSWVSKFVVKKSDSQMLDDESAQSIDSPNDDADDFTSDRHSDIFSHRANNHLTPIRTARTPGSATNTLSTLTPMLTPGSVPGTPHDDFGRRRQSTAADILRPEQMTLSHGMGDFDDTDPSNMIARAMKQAWATINSFENILDEQVLNTIDVSDLIDDFMATNLINLSLKLRNLFYKIEEVDDINARRTHEERKILLKLLDLADEEERFRAKKYLEKVNEEHANFSDTASQGSIPVNLPAVLSMEEITQRAEQRKQRRARSIWANEDLQAKLLEEQPNHVGTMTNIDFTFIDHLQKESHRLGKRCTHLQFMMEDMASNFPLELDRCKQETKAAFEKLYVKDTEEFSCQFDTVIPPIERVVVKQAKDESLQNFASSMTAVFDSMNANEDMPPEMRSQVKSLMGLVMADHKLQQEQKKLDKAEKKARKKGSAKRTRPKRSHGASGGGGGEEDGEDDATASRLESAETPRGDDDDEERGDDGAALPTSKAGISTSAALADKYAYEQIQNSTSDVNIMRRVVLSPPPSRPEIGQSVKIERWQEEEKPQLKNSKSAATSAQSPRPPPIVPNSEPRRRYSAPPADAPMAVFKKPPPLPPTRVVEFDISEAPEKWQQRREDLVRERYENMKKILQAFYTIVYEGTMHGYFKTLWDDDEDTVHMRGGVAMRATPAMLSSHHFNPQYTGKGGFEYLMNSSIQRVEKAIKKEGVPKRSVEILEEPFKWPDMMEDDAETSNGGGGGAQRRSSTTSGGKVAVVRSVSQGSKRSLVLPPPRSASGSVASSKGKNAPSADMSEMFSTSKSGVAREAGHRLLRK